MMYRSFLNMDLLPQIEEFDGDYPIIKKQPFLDYPFIGFNEALSSNNVEKIYISFYTTINLRDVGETQKDI